MAYICTKPRNYCKECPHYRYDDDYDAMSCFATLDEKTQNSHNTNKNTDETRKVNNNA